ncbi:MAG TPA: hypothetical protein VHG93_13505 [Longimicrobium sp.]|nr:hypothetical protein [Longimicrobium sp.]
MTLRLRPLLLALLPLALAFALPRAAAAQVADTVTVSADTVYEVRLSDGSVLYGRVMEQTAEELTLETQAGATVRLRRSQVVSIRPLRGRVVDGRVWGEDPHATRLFFGPTARAIPRGEGYFGVYELFFPFVSYGVTDRFTISGGTPVFPEIIGEIFYFAPKYEVLRTPAASAAVGVLALFATRELNGSAGLLYGVGTLGTPDRALTVGATVPFIASGEDSEVGDQPAFMIGGEARLTRRTKFLTENYFVPGESGALISGGVRFFGERLSADFGLGAGFGDGDNACCLPLVNFVYSF